MRILIPLPEKYNSMMQSTHQSLGWVNLLIPMSGNRNVGGKDIILNVEMYVGGTYLHKLDGKSPVHLI